MRRLTLCALAALFLLALFAPAAIAQDKPKVKTIEEFDKDAFEKSKGGTKLDEVKGISNYKWDDKEKVVNAATRSPTDISATSPPTASTSPSMA